MKAVDVSLHDLAPLACAQGGPFYGNSVLRIPTELSPQKILHWVAGSALASIDLPFCTTLVNGMVAHGADLFVTTALRELKGPTYKTQKAAILVRQRENPEGGGLQSFQTTLKLTHASPLGAAMVVMNAPALEVMLASIESAAKTVDASQTVAITQSGERLDAWALAAVLRFCTVPTRLDTVMGQSGWDSPAHARRLGDVLVSALKDNAIEARSESVNNRTGLSKFAQEILLRGPVLSPDDLIEHNIDPASLMLMATQLNDGSASRVIEQLAAMGFSANLQQASGTTALHMACEQEKARTVAALLEAGAHVKAMDAQGQTFEDLARLKHPCMLAVLQSWTLRKLAMATMKELLPTQQYAQPSKNALG